MVLTVSADGREFIERIRSYLKPSELERVQSAFEYAREKHAGQFRKSGEPFYTHPTTVAYYLAEYQINGDALIAALLHDVAEDTPASVAEIGALYGDEVGQIVDGVTKFEQSADDIQRNGQLSSEQKNNATYTKLFRFMTRDVRVVLIKLFDRLHNIRTIGSMPHHKQVHKAHETLNIYARIANRLGLWNIKNELEDRCFQILNADMHQHITRLMRRREHEQRELVAKIQTELKDAFTNAGVPFLKVCRSPRNAYSIYQKARRQSNSARIDVDHIPRMLIVVPERLTCYTALGILHSVWQPRGEEFRDFIARPRENMYRALHTAINHRSGTQVKFRVRSQAMSIVSDIGILGRWAPGAQFVTPDIQREMEEQVNALFANIDHNIGSDKNDKDVVEGVVTDVLSKQIRVYTPKGESLELPADSTPLDFAYKIHTELGHTCHSAYVNGERVPLNTSLSDGATVSIHKRTRTPRRIWLDEELAYVRTTNARSQIRRWFRRLPERIAIRQGRNLLDAELEMLGLPEFKHNTVAQWMGYPSTRGLYFALGRAEMMRTAVARRVLAHVWQEGVRRQIGRKVVSHENEEFIILGAQRIIEPLHLCRNCHPIPGDKIRGYIRPGKRVTIHRADCMLLPYETSTNRQLQLRWGEEMSGEVREAYLEISVYDRPNLLYEITDLLRDELINISDVSTPRVRGELRVDLCIEVNSPRQLVGILHRMQTLVNVRQVVVRSEIDPLDLL